MQINSNLKIKNDEILVSDLKNLVKKEREVLTEILHYLKEVETRKIYLAQGYSSLFAWMLKELGYSEASAQRRIAAMRLIKEIPEVEEKIERGEISLSVVSQVQSFFRKEDQKRIEDKKARIKPEEKLDLLERLSGTSARECEKKLIQLNPVINLPKERTKPLTEDKTLIQFTADKNLLAKINRLKTLLSHQNPEQSLEKIFDKITDLALEKLDPERRHARREKRKNLKETQATNPRPGTPKSPRPGVRQALPTSEVGRYLPPKLRDFIWVRDKGRCQFRNKKTGELCGSKKSLEIDHRYPHALGGENNEENLRMVCRSHNQFRAGVVFRYTSRT